MNEPGIHFNELLRRTGLAAGNLVWHLDILLTYKVIGKKRIGNFIAYFPYYQKNPLSNVDLKLQKSKLTIEILEKQKTFYDNRLTNLRARREEISADKLKEAYIKMGAIPGEKEEEEKDG